MKENPNLQFDYYVHYMG